MLNCHCHLRYSTGEFQAFQPIVLWCLYTLHHVAISAQRTPPPAPTPVRGVYRNFISLKQLARISFKYNAFQVIKMHEAI